MYSHISQTFFIVKYFNKVKKNLMIWIFFKKKLHLQTFLVSIKQEINNQLCISIYDNNRYESIFLKINKILYFIMFFVDTKQYADIPFNNMPMKIISFNMSVNVLYFFYFLFL